MGRRKKQIEEVQEGSSPVIHGDAKRSIVAIFLFIIAILFVLGFLSDIGIVDAGIAGEGLNWLAERLFGFGKYVSPLVLLIAGVILLFRKETLFYVSKLAGMTLAFFSILAFVHIVAYEPDQLYVAAKAGSGGGIVGFLLGFVMLKLTGKIGGAIILVALFAVGLIFAFNFSLAALIRKFIRKKVEGLDQQEAQEDEEEYVIGDLEDPVVENKKDEQVEYVQDPNEAEEDEENEEEEMPKKSILKKAMLWGTNKKAKTAKEMTWQLPPISLLETSSNKAQGGDVKKNAKIIQDTFRHFGIEVEPGEILTGPTVTQYSFRPAVGVKLSRITSLSNDLSLALAVHPIRIEAPIPGKSLIGIEVPNKSVATVRMPELLQTEEFENRCSNLLLALGKDVSGNYIYGDLKKMPHLMIAGSTGAGKSVCANTILLSMLYQNSPEDLRLILVDPKRVELSLYNGIPHLLSDVIVENSKVVSALKWAIGEMERRYKLLQETGSRDIGSFNQKAEAGEKRTITNKETNETHQEDLEKLPYIVIVIDELADLMASHGKEVEGAIIRLAQMARAVGIHLIVSTQRPSVEVITGLIKANIATRIAFKVATQIDSRTILDSAGAEKLLGNGDMLFSSVAVAGMRRLQGVYVSESEVKRVVEFIKKQGQERGEESLEDEILEGIEENEVKILPTQNPNKLDFDSMEFPEDNLKDVMFEEAKKVIIQTRKASTSFLQRRLGIGYSRAARLMDQLEEHGIVGPQDGAKPRDVLVGASGVQYEDEISDQAVRDKWQM